jgi:hypothetical protein
VHGIDLRAKSEVSFKSALVYLFIYLFFIFIIIFFSLCSIHFALTKSVGFLNTIDENAACCW